MEMTIEQKRIQKRITIEALEAALEKATEDYHRKLSYYEAGFQYEKEDVLEAERRVEEVGEVLLAVKSKEEG